MTRLETDIFPTPSIVLGMAKYGLYVDDLELEVYRCDQSIVVTPYVEDDASSNQIRRRECLLCLSQVRPFFLPGNPIPGIQGAFCIRLALPELSQPSSANYSQALCHINGAVLNQLDALILRDSLSS